MVQKETNLKPIDRCGVWSVRAFHLYGGSFKKITTISNFVKFSVKRTKPDNWVPKKTKLKGLLVILTKELSKIDGSYTRFRSNGVVMLKKRLTPKGKVLMGPASLKLRRKKFLTSFGGAI